jgi:hypothetical protein
LLAGWVGVRGEGTGLERTRQHCGPETLAHYAENHGELVDCESRAAEVVFVVPHVAVLELAPLDLVQVEAPDDGHGCGGCRVCVYVCVV